MRSLMFLEDAVTNAFADEGMGYFGDLGLTKEEREHAHHTQQQTQHAKDLHVTNQVDSKPQVFNLGQQAFVFIRMIAVIQTADDRRERQKTVGIRQHQKRNCWE